MREWHFLWHFPQVKVVAGLSAWRCVFLRDLFSSACYVRFSTKRESPFFTSCFQVDLSAAAASDVLVMTPRALRSRLQMSLYRSCGPPVGLFLSPVQRREGRWGMRPFSSRKTQPSLPNHLMRLCSRRVNMVDQDVCSFVCHCVSPRDAKDASQAAYVKYVESPLLPGAQGPGFAVVQ